MIKAFTDGSASGKQGPGAWAACIVDRHEEQMLHGTAEKATQHTMELTAVIQALKYIQFNKKKVEWAEVYTDSQYVVDLPQRRRRLEINRFVTRGGKPVKNSALVREFYNLLDQTSVRLIKVESHERAGKSEATDYNRKVDKLSRRLLRKMRRKG